MTCPVRCSWSPGGRKGHTCANLPQLPPAPAACGSGHSRCSLSNNGRQHLGGNAAAPAAAPAAAAAAVIDATAGSGCCTQQRVNQPPVLKLCRQSATEGPLVCLPPSCHSRQTSIMALRPCQHSSLPSQETSAVSWSHQLAPPLLLHILHRQPVFVSK